MMYARSRARGAALLLALGMALAPKAALAGTAEADACAAQLGEVGQQIYAAVAPTFASGDDIRAAMRSAVGPLVQSGAISEADARASARNVAMCLNQT